MEEEKKLWWHYGSGHPKEGEAIKKAFMEKGVCARGFSFNFATDFFFGVENEEIACTSSAKHDVINLVKSIGTELPIHVEPEHKHFETFDKVLVAMSLDAEDDRKVIWHPALYSFEYNNTHFVIGDDHPFDDDEIMPYKGNESKCNQTDYLG